jgi:hypothetical protein
MHIVAMFPADNYIVAQAANKVLLLARRGASRFGGRMLGRIHPGFTPDSLLPDIAQR